MPEQVYLIKMDMQVYVKCWNGAKLEGLFNERLNFINHIADLARSFFSSLRGSSVISAAFTTCHSIQM